MNYHVAPITALPATGFVFSGIWLVLAIVTLLVLGLALMRLKPKDEQ